MLSDPLTLKNPDVITASGAATLYSAMPDASPYYRDYRQTSEDATSKTTRSIRVGNYPTGSSSKRRLVVSKQVKKYDLVNQVELPTRQITISFVYDENMVDADLAALKSGVQDLCWLIANTTDGGLFDRLIAGEI